MLAFFYINLSSIMENYMFLDPRVTSRNDLRVVTEKRIKVIISIQKILYIRRSSTIYLEVTIAIIFYYL